MGRQFALSAREQTQTVITMRSLEDLASLAFLEFLERECKAYVTLVRLNSPYLNSAKEALMEAMTGYLSGALSRLQRSEAARIRSTLVHLLVRAHYPSPASRNGYKLTETAAPVDALATGEDRMNHDIDAMKASGRKCCSICCSGAFLVETMMSVLVDPDLDEIAFPKTVPSIAERIYKDKPLQGKLFFDLNTVLYHYVQSLMEHPTVVPYLNRIDVRGVLYGRLDEQEDRYKLLSVSAETGDYLDVAAALSGNQPPLMENATAYTMQLMCELFESRSASVPFENLTHLLLNNECLSTRSASWRRTNDDALSDRLMFGIGQSCPHLKALDLSQVSQLAPECLLYLIYNDAYRYLHKYMYLPADYPPFYALDTGLYGTEAPHDPRQRPCPWCYIGGDKKTPFVQDLRPDIYVLDDRLYEFVERHPEAQLDAGAFLKHCVKASQLLLAFEDSVYTLRNKQLDVSRWFSDMKEAPALVKRQMDERQTQTRLCRSMEELRLPMDVHDAKSWFVPLFLHAMPNLVTLGQAEIYDGLDMMKNVRAFDDFTPRNCKLKELQVDLNDGSFSRIHETVKANMRSMEIANTLWGQKFSGPYYYRSFGNANIVENQFSLKAWIKKDVLQGQNVGPLFNEPEDVKTKWTGQLKELTAFCPLLTALTITVQSGVLDDDGLSAAGASVWEPLRTGLPLLEALSVHGSWTDAADLLSCVGRNLKSVQVDVTTALIPKFSNNAVQELRQGYVDWIGHYCPHLVSLAVGYQKPGQAYSLKYALEVSDAFPDPNFATFRRLEEFVVLGNVTCNAYKHVFERAHAVKNITVLGKVVAETDADSPAFSEMTFTKERLLHSFSDNPLPALENYEVDMVLNSIETARYFLEILPTSAKRVSHLRVKVFVQMDAAGEDGPQIGDLIAQTFRQMVEFKLSVKKRELQSPLGSKIEWSWEREGILTVLLQQNMLQNISELLEP